MRQRGNGLDPISSQKTPDSRDEKSGSQSRILGSAVPILPLHPAIPGFLSLPSGNFPCLSPGDGISGVFGFSRNFFPEFPGAFGWMRPKGSQILQIFPIFGRFPKNSWECHLSLLIPSFGIPASHSFFREFPPSAG